MATITAVAVVAEVVGGSVGETTSHHATAMPPSTSSQTGKCSRRSISTVCLS